MMRATGLSVWVGAVLLAMVSVASAQPVLMEDFEGAGDLAERGWRVEPGEAQSVWTVVDWHLEAVCPRNPYKGGRIVRDVPVIERGVLEFDCRLGVEGQANYDHLSLGFRLFGHLMAFKKYGGHHLLVHVPAENIMYSVTGTVPLGEWVHLRVEFDAPRGRVEYYLGDERDPLKIDTRLTMNTEGETGELEVFNYGLTKGTVTNWVDNISLRALETGDEETGGARDRTLLILGPSSERLGVEAVVRAAVPADRLAVYTMQTRSAATRPTNILALDKVPGASTWRQARQIILADVPAGPGECLPPHLLDDLQLAVRDGADLLVLGGAFAVGNGQYAGTVLEELLPVEAGGPWQLRRFDTAQTLADGAAVLWYHDAPLKPGEARTALPAGGTPMFAWQVCENGRVGVFLGAALGSREDFGGRTPFWEWDGWPDLLERMISIGGVTGEEE